MKNHKFEYICTDCNARYDPGEVTYLCPVCSKANKPGLPPGGVLKTIFNYDGIIKKGTTFSQLKKNRFLDLLPVEMIESLPNLHIGNTPLYSITKINNSGISFNLFLKDDSQNPTYSFKDRASAIVSAYARENGFQTIVAASTGNAGSSLAGICAAQNQKAIILVPETAPVAKLTQILMYGATLIPVRGTYDDAYDLSIMATEKFGWYNRNTAYNPLTIEGKKTVAFELFEQLNYTVPDTIFVPVGDGVIISGVYKGFEDLMKLQITDRMPVIVAVQSEKSDNLVRNIPNAQFETIKSTSIADSISVDIPRNFFMAKKYISEYKGEMITVTDKEILEASSILAANTGLFAEPAAAASFAGLLSYRKKNKIGGDSNNVVLLTGSGLKDQNAFSGKLHVPEPIIPTMDNLIKFVS